MTHDKRNYSLDFIRIVSIIAVIVIHSICIIVTQADVYSEKWMIGNIIDSSVRWSVPVFIIISGSLVIKPGLFNSRKYFIKNKLMRIAAPLAIWPIIYLVWCTVTTDNSKTDLSNILNGYISGAPISAHLYFLFLIAGLYVITPFLSLYSDSVTKKQLLHTSIILLSVTAAWSTITSLIPGYDYGQRLTSITMWIPYVGFYLFGYALNEYKLKKIWTPLLVFILSGTCLALITKYMYITYGIDRGLVFYSYTSIPVIVMSVSAYMFLRVIFEKISAKIEKNKQSDKLLTMVRNLSSATFCVYLIHVIVMDLIVRLFDLRFMSLRDVLIIIISTVTVSYILSLFIVRIPVLKRITQ